jgi:hypothetical protein
VIEQVTGRDERRWGLGSGEGKIKGLATVAVHVIVCTSFLQALWLRAWHMAAIQATD